MLMIFGPLTVMILGMLINIWTAWGRDLERMMSALQSSVWLEMQRRIWGEKRLFSRWILLGTISGVLAMSRIHIKRGELDANEYVNFPSSLRLRVVLADAMMLGAILVFLSILGLYKLHE
ncbi:hypothetical protein [Pseudomonas plecoglossicida]|uniref:hypothetical protein n=1 Tax=Pseudomonas plecoglossicida TaxID=70775 RepID=UPI0015E33A9E|nr:hypothetical protein [Pseudomonas plecoglossicida]MBA1322017.1 hypothetical protein [Pseudomonas plecoglossicida]